MKKSDLYIAHLKQNLPVLIVLLIAISLPMIGFQVYNRSTTYIDANNQNRMDYEGNLALFMTFQEHAIDINAGINTIMLKSRKASRKDIGAIDFSLPGESTYGDNPEEELYNRRGYAKLSPYNINYNYKYYTPDSQLFVTRSYKEKPRFNVTPTNLVAVLTHVNINEKFCRLINERLANKDVLPQTSTPPLRHIYGRAAQTVELVEFPARKGCAKAPDGYFYYFLLRL